MNGGKLNSAENTGLIELEFSTGETAVETDLPEPMYSLITKSAVRLRMVPEMDNGTLLSALSQFKVKRLDL